MSRPAADRQRVEALILLAMLVSVIVDGAINKNAPETIEAAAALSSAISETVEGLPFETRQKLYRRRDRIDAAAVAPLRVIGQPVSAFGLAIYCFLDAATESGALVIGAESALSRALDRILPALETAACEPGGMRRARITAARLLEGLRHEGLFLDPTLDALLATVEAINA